MLVYCSRRTFDTIQWRRVNGKHRRSMRYGLTQRLLITPRGVTWRPMWGTVENTNRDQKSKRLTIFNIPTVFLFTTEADKGIFCIRSPKFNIKRWHHNHHHHILYWAVWHTAIASMTGTSNYKKNKWYTIHTLDKGANEYNILYEIKCNIKSNS